MKSFTIEPIQPFNVKLKDIAPDKSISHRAALFSLLSDKPTKVRNFLQGEDTLNMLDVVQKLGATIVKKNGRITITPPKKIIEPEVPLECGNAGTAMRLLLGFLASQKGFFVLKGDNYLSSRPMKRVVEPLRSIGADISGRSGGGYAPLSINGKQLRSFKYKSNVASAQVKSAMILAALQADKKSIYSEPELSRDHTEKMLKAMGADIKTEGKTVYIKPIKKPLKPLDIDIPSDPSSAFFFAIAVALVPDSRIVLKNMLLNKTRIEAFKILKKMGLHVEFNIKENSYEKVGDIHVKHSPLKGVVVSKNISHLIDEIPALAIAFAVAKGKSVVKNARELRVKESDRIKSVVTNLKKTGIKVEEKDDGFIVYGGDLKKAKVDSFGDHRIAMSFIIAGLRCGMEVDDVECIKTSFPNFFKILKKLKKG